MKCLDTKTLLTMLNTALLETKMSEDLGCMLCFYTSVLWELKSHLKILLIIIILSQLRSTVLCLQVILDFKHFV